MLITKVLFATTARSFLFSSSTSLAFSYSNRRIHSTVTKHPHSTFRRQRSQNHLPISRSSEASLYMSTETSSSMNSRVALLQFKVTDSKSQNHETASAFLAKAAAQNAKLAVLPEIWNGPYATAAFAEYAEVLPSIGDGDPAEVESSSARLLMEKAKEHNIYIIGGSIPERVIENSSELIYNTCLCINPDGKIVGKHRKVHLFDIDVPGKITFKESDTLSPGTGLTAFDAKEPFGMIGIGICYDIRFPELAQCLIERGCRILIFPGAFNLTTGPAHWELLQKARAVDGQCYVLTASPARSDPPNTPGKYPHYSAWGHSTAISPWGEVVATCNEEENVVIVDLDMSKVEEMRESIPTSLQKRKDLYSLSDLAKST